MSFVSQNNKFFKIRRKSDGHFYYSSMVGGGFSPGGGNINQNLEDMAVSKANLERNLEGVNFGDLEIVEYELKEVAIH